MIETLPHDWYHDSETFAIECDRIFRRHWWLIGPESEIAASGDYQSFDLMKWPLVVVRGQDALLRGFYNLCRHRAGPLVTGGNGRCRDFVCRYHGWRYACSGELLKTPGFEPDAVGDKNELGLLPVRVECWNGMVFVCLDESAPDLVTWLGDIVDIAADYDRVESLGYDGMARRQAAANWKTYGDNSCEGYHVGMVHGALGSSMQRESVRVDGYANGQFVGFDVTYGAGEDHSRAGKGFWIYKFPGLLLHFAEYAFNAESVFPRAADAIELRRWFWSDPVKAKAHGIDSETIRPASEQVIDEDLWICELVQRNLASGVYPGGTLSPRQEPGTVFFQQLVRAALARALEPAQRGGRG